MKLTLSFIFVAIALLQMTTASPVAKDVQGHGRKNIAYMFQRVHPICIMSNKTIQIQLPRTSLMLKMYRDTVERISRDHSDSVAEDLSDAEDVEKRVEKTLASIVSEESRDVQGVVEVSSTAPIRHFWAVIYKS
ncbi:uncharacterized protein BJ212DRAFT_1297118 [Suillus subaureus]|uniref:Uncharacterized protein n=1 Tax=Suillus subaureus TaxID=48587 RepID=A0A9P7EHE6_9AGAM|nr:uncharacterized protein BJ212DRAFT_1297118 [Suillus subaureus]KAG1821805.1 hypothetical protein BJ212DRAFT_1297118 [Suillus subaureus]